MLRIFSCTNCKSEVETKDNRKKFCNQSCAAIFNNRLSPKRTKQAGFCTGCGVELSRYDRKYCSQICQGNHVRHQKAHAGELGKHGLRRYLVETRVYACTNCGQDGEWFGRPLRLQMDHIDGNPNNNTLENVRWLCPNCHTQTETWGAANMSEEGRARLRSNIKCEEASAPPSTRASAASG